METIDDLIIKTYSKERLDRLMLRIEIHLLAQCCSREEEIIRTVCSCVNESDLFINHNRDRVKLTPELMLSKTRLREAVIGRQIVSHVLRISSHILRHEHNYSFAKIGIVLGGLNHATIMHSLVRFDEYIETDSEYKQLVERVLERLKLRQ